MPHLVKIVWEDQPQHLLCGSTDAEKQAQNDTRETKNFIPAFRY